MAISECDVEVAIDLLFLFLASALSTSRVLLCSPLKRKTRPLASEHSRSGKLGVIVEQKTESKEFSRDGDFSCEFFSVHLLWFVNQDLEG